ncbi:MAG: sugar ABC transporter permease [Candidatus Anaerobiospirillum merdipullorum]|uniref:Xylose transport system permease protein XylH n=1 Tax=Candidatus Anaerobiospirillum merdipullorum TaxID=2838450 RepID=A0A9E2KQ37_9GAMM|nr:sugar ABC transporter permease [Candidatus Anaerobiospirillum merdipullorum]
MNQISNILKRNSLLMALIAVMIFFEIIIRLTDHGSLFSPANFTNIISQNSYVIILAVGMLFCIIACGNIDLAVGSIVALVGAIAGVLMVNLEFNVYASIAICLLVGIAIGAWQGFWIAYIRIPSFIVTLAGMMLFRGMALLVLDGLTISPFPPEYLRFFTSFIPRSRADAFTLTVIITAILVAIYLVAAFYDRMSKLKKGYEVEDKVTFFFKLGAVLFALIASGLLLANNKGIPVILILLTVIVLCYSFIANRTVAGRRLYALGGNEKAAKLSGVNTNRMLFFTYVNMGFLSAVAALVCVARFNSAAPTAGNGYELDAIGACFIGGASAYGGVGKVGGAVIGAVFMGVLNNGMSILGIDANWQRTVKGLVLLLAVVIDVLSKKRVQA